MGLFSKKEKISVDDMAMRMMVSASESIGKLRCLFDWYDTVITQENVIEYFEEQEDEASLSIVGELLRAFNAKETPFDSIFKFFKAFSMCELEEEVLYYEWEGMYIDFYDNICDTGERRGEYENLSTTEWLHILKNIDEYIIHADYEV